MQPSHVITASEQVLFCCFLYPSLHFILSAQFKQVSLKQDLQLGRNKTRTVKTLVKITLRRRKYSSHIYICKTGLTQHGS